MKLFEPLHIASMKLKNRIAMAPMATNYADESGAVNPKLKGYYAKRARGGAGLIITESGYIHPLGRGGSRRLGLHDDSLIPALKGLVDAVHVEGAMISSELHHAGRQVNVNIHGIYPVSCSSIPSAMEQVVPRTLMIQEIEELIAAFGQAARRCISAGFDGILIHAAHGYLIQQFLSPLTNKRKDCYGGSFRGRLRFLQEIVQHCREIVGTGYPLMVRISAHEFVRGGLNLKDSQRIAKYLQCWGVDAIHVSAGSHEVQEMQVPPMVLPRGTLADLAEGIKKVVDIPVAVVGRIVDPEMAEELLQKGKADLVTLGRALIADPAFPKKVQEGKWEDIRPCIGCLQGCLAQLAQGNPITCLVNPAVGKETEGNPKPAEKNKKVWVIGGGPAGMEAAAISASRGHEVTLWEKNSRLGGQFYMASLLPFKKEIQSFLNYLSRQVNKCGVKVHLNREITLGELAETDTDVVILANGAIPYKPNLPGIDRPNVLTAWEAINRPATTGKKVLIIGGGSVGAETAELLADHQKTVTLIEMQKEIASDAERTHRKLLLFRLGEKGVKIRVLTEVKEIRDNGVEAEFKGKKEFLEGETVVIAMGMVANRELETALRELKAEVYRIGDCQKPRKAIDAINEGFQIGLKI